MPSIARQSEDATAANASSTPTNISGPSTTTTINLLIVLIVLVATGLLLGGALFVLRRARRAKKSRGSLPSYDAATRNHHGLRISTRDSAFVYSEKQNLIENSSPMPMSPESIPEIRITFPEEEDKETGRRISGKVMVVAVGEAGVGYVKPLPDDDLPAYQQRTQSGFAPVDLDKYGGLKEAS